LAISNDFRTKWHGLDQTNIPDNQKQAMDTYAADNARTGRYLDFGSELLNEATYGIEYSTFVIPAPANLGKSALLLSMYHKLLMHNEDVFVVDFTLDDTFDIRFRNSIARLAKIPINSVRYPQQIDQKAKEARTMAVKQWNTDIRPRSIIIDKLAFNSHAADLTILEKMIYYAKDKHTGSEKKLVVIIDGLHDLRADDFQGNYQNNLQLEGWISKRISDIADKAECTIISSAHTPKGSRQRGNSPDAIKGSSNFGYDAKIIGTIYSDYKINRGKAEIWHDCLLPDKPDIVQRLPVIELDITKNKVAEFSDIIFMKHYPSFALVEEAPLNWQEHWKNVIYGTNQSDKE